MTTCYCKLKAQGKCHFYFMCEQAPCAKKQIKKINNNH